MHDLDIRLTNRLLLVRLPAIVTSHDLAYIEDAVILVLKQLRRRAGVCDVSTTREEAAPAATGSNQRAPCSPYRLEDLLKVVVEKLTHDPGRTRTELLEGTGLTESELTSVILTYRDKFRKERSKTDGRKFHYYLVETVQAIDDSTVNGVAHATE